MSNLVEFPAVQPADTPADDIPPCECGSTSWLAIPGPPGMEYVTAVECRRCGPSATKANVLPFRKPA